MARSNSRWDSGFGHRPFGGDRPSLRGCVLQRRIPPAARSLRPPGEVLLCRVRLRHHAPVVDRAGRAGRDVLHASFTDFCVDDVVVVVMRERMDWAGLLAGIAPDADVRLDQMLLERCAVTAIEWPSRVVQPLQSWNETNRVPPHEGLPPSNALLAASPYQFARLERDRRTWNLGLILPTGR
jgi:hypothetical protein